MAFSLVFCEAMTRRRLLGYASSDFFGNASNLFTFYALWVKFFLTLKLSDVWQILFDKCVFPHLSVCRLVSLNAELVSLVRNWVFCLKFRPYFCLKIVFFLFESRTFLLVSTPCYGFEVGPLFVLPTILLRFLYIANWRMWPVNSSRSPCNSGRER